jgi:hypothetical protein
MIKYTYHTRLETGLILPLEQLSPVNAVEEVVCLDLGCTLGSQPLVRIAIEEPGQQISRSRWYNLWAREVQWLSEDLAVHVVGVLVVEGWQACQHLVEKNTECQPIDRLGVASTGEELGREVLGRSTEGCGLLAERPWSDSGIY